MDSADAVAGGVAALRAWVCALVVTALLLGGCSAERGTEVYLAEYAALAGAGVDTTRMFPGPDAPRHVLDAPVQPSDDAPVWLVGSSMRLRFYAVAESARTLLIEARPPTPPGAPGQTVSVILDGSVVTSRAMEPGWQEYEFPLPMDAIERGWNSVELRFERTIRPADFDSFSNDRRELAARFRRVAIRLDEPTAAAAVDRRVSIGFAADARTEDVDRGATTAAPTAVRDFSSATIDMPAASMIDLYLLPRPDTELLGELSVAPDDTAGAITARIEIVDATGSETVWQGNPSDSWRGRLQVHADLGGWAGDLVQLRIRVSGAHSASARWSRLRTRSSVADFDERLGIPEPVQVVAPQSAGERPDIFVVLLDAARADAVLGERGRELAPNVTALAAQGTTFREAWSPSAWTGQSVPAMLTGMTPDTLGFDSWESRLPPGFDTLPGLLRAAGYHTLLFSQHTFYDPHREILDDFDRVETTLDRDRLPLAEYLNDIEQPIFALVHLLPPHDPYDAPAPFGGTRSAWYEGDLDLSVDLLRTFYEAVPERERAEVRRLAIARYEENVAYADHLVGQFITRLRESGRYDDAVVVVVSDHGEAFGEHGRFLHSDQLFEEFIHVPLVIKWPDGRGEFPAGVETPVSTIDLAPTLIALAGTGDRRARFQGRSLVAPDSGAAPANRLLLSQTGTGGWPRYALRWGDLKLMYWERTRTARLFDLAADPAERDDIADRMPVQTQAMLQALRVALARNAAVLVAAGDAATEALDAETLRRLRALGYLR